VDEAIEKIRQEIVALKSDIKDLIDQRDTGAQLLRVLSLNVAPADVATAEGDRVWELCGTYLFNVGRIHEALIIFLTLYELKLAAQAAAGRVHKGSPLIWASFCFAALGFPAHAKRYAMLALCEDAVLGKGHVSPDGGAYFHLLWKGGMREEELRSRLNRTLQHLANIPRHSYRTLTTSGSVRCPRPPSHFTMFEVTST
jgi:hypothetical protein